MTAPHPADRVSGARARAVASEDDRRPPRRMRAVYIGVDATNPTLILRIRSLRRAGVELFAFTFRRRKFNAAFEPDWPNAHLGDTEDRRYGRRLLPLVRALRIMLGRRELFQGTDFIYTRNMDLAFLGVFIRTLLRLDCKLVYEVEDVQEIFFKKTFAGALFRRLEGWVLRRADLLVVTSPGFMRGYFLPAHHYRGPFYVLENKIQLGDAAQAPTAAGRVWEGIRDRWVIGWFGTLRCPTSMAILGEIAERLGDRVEIRTRGYPTETGLAPFLDIVARHPNWTHGGEYTIPDDLEEMYGGAHFSWCLDFLDPEGNSPLLLACRMYQGGYFGAVPLVAEGSEMERFLRRAGIGHAFGPPYAEAIARFLESLRWEDYAAERRRVVAQRDALFLEDGRDVRGLLDAIRRL